MKLRTGLYLYTASIEPTWCCTSLCVRRDNFRLEVHAHVCAQVELHAANLRFVGVNCTRIGDQNS